jgi:hypothetical protein
MSIRGDRNAVIAGLVEARRLAFPVSLGATELVLLFFSGTKLFFSEA